jgi:hypothetical protein
MSFFIASSHSQLSVLKDHPQLHHSSLKENTEKAGSHNESLTFVSDLLASTLALVNFFVNLMIKI